MDFQTLDALRKRHPAWRLLVADSAPFVASFLHRSFVEPNLRTIAQPELVAYLSLAAQDTAERRALIDDEQKQTIAWTDPIGRQRRATLPLVVDCR